MLNHARPAAANRGPVVDYAEHLSRVHHGQARLCEFRDLEPRLRYLLEHYAPPRRSVHPEYPFWRLQADGLWDIPRRHEISRLSASGDPARRELVSRHITGGFPQPIDTAFRKDRALFQRAIATLLEAQFPRSVQEDLLADLELPGELSTSVTPRDLTFRQAVLQAYEHSCAVCSFDLRLGGSDLALEAAHVKSRQAGGPDDVQNGLALCAIHHKAFDKGALAIHDNLTLMVSADVHGEWWARDFFYTFGGRKIRSPNRSEASPRNEYLRWHRTQVFRGPARD